MYEKLWFQYPFWLAKIVYIYPIGSFDYASTHWVTQYNGQWINALKALKLILLFYCPSKGNVSPLDDMWTMKVKSGTNGGKRTPHSFNFLKCPTFSNCSNILANPYLIATRSSLLHIVTFSSLGQVHATFHTFTISSLVWIQMTC